MTYLLCDVCDKPIDDDDDDYHDYHEPDCPRAADPDSDFVCDCDLVAHSECCPCCKEERENEVHDVHQTNK